MKEASLKRLRHCMCNSLEKANYEEVKRMVVTKIMKEGGINRWRGKDF